MVALRLFGMYWHKTVRDVLALTHGGLQKIRPTSALPAITVPVVIDGTTQPGYAGPPLIVLNGGSAGASGNGASS